MNSKLLCEYFSLGEENKMGYPVRYCIYYNINVIYSPYEMSNGIYKYISVSPYTTYIEIFIDYDLDFIVEYKGKYFKYSKQTNSFYEIIKKDDYYHPYFIRDNLTDKNIEYYKLMVIT